MTITAPHAAGTGRDARLYRDLNGILGIIQVTPWLPRWSISEDQAAFFFAGLPADEAAQAVRDAETILGYALGARFTDRFPRPVGSTRHHIRTARLASGLTVELVALAEHMDSPDAREDAPVREMAKVA